MDKTQITLLIGIIIGTVIGYLIARIYLWIMIKTQRKDAIDRSKSVLLGHVNEQLAPLLPTFPYNFKDAMFLGKGVDYVVFDGLYEGEVKNVVFLEVKSGNSSLNKNERNIKDAINAGKVRYEVVKL